MDTSRSHAAGRSEGNVPGNWLVVISGCARRRDEEAKYQARRRALASSHAKLHAFETIDIPEFHSWFESELAGPLGMMRLLQRELDQLERQLAEIETYAAYAGVSLRAACKTIQAAQDSGDIDRLWGDTTWSEPQGMDHEIPETEPHPQDSKPRRESELRDVYKQLVRLLHPDLHPERPHPQLWHEVQRAYAARDAEALERIRATILKAAKHDPDLTALPISEIMSLRRGVEKKLRQARQRLRAAKDHPAWNFRRYKKNPVRRRALRCSLSAAISMDVESMQARVRALKLTLKRLER
ncbi:MAG: hypothetical protein FJ146_06185 [Deltaproteobacteria bacterium]|nr:hypothetical protein [Deltaproteobacteria bacterium]